MNAATARGARIPGGIPAQAGIGLRAVHVRAVLDAAQAPAWVEVHSENYFGDGGQPLRLLDRVRCRTAVSLHGVGLGLGSCTPLQREHLARLRRLIERFEPALVSEHLCWNASGARWWNELLPLPYTGEALRHVCERIDRAQEALGRQLLIENVSSYLSFACSTMTEPQFLSEVARRTGCGILLDVNNVYVSAHNHGWDAYAYLDAIAPSSVSEIHVAGHLRSGSLLIDTHSTSVSEPVWALLAYALERTGPLPVLVEWDADLPPLATLLEQAARAQSILEAEHVLAG